MTAISDASDIPVWGLGAWTLFALGVAIVLGGWWLVMLVMRAPLHDAEPSALDIRDGALLDCYNAGGHYFRLDDDRAAYTCARCGQRVDRAGVEL